MQDHPTRRQVITGVMAHSIATRSCVSWRTEDERGPPKALIARSFFAAKIGWIHFSFREKSWRACSFNALADNIWSYHQESDRLTNRTYSLARSPMPTRGLYDDIKLEIVCKDNNLQVVIDADSLIASQNSTFDVEYQIDKKTPVTIQMRTFKDSKRKGYSDGYAKRIADDILTGQSIFIRVHTMIKNILSGSISLENAAEPIKRVFADCGLTVADSATSEPVYSLAEFEQEFSKLSSEQQQQVLSKIKKMMMEIQLR